MSVFDFPRVHVFGSQLVNAGPVHRRGVAGAGVVESAVGDTPAITSGTICRIPVWNSSDWSVAIRYWLAPTGAPANVESRWKPPVLKKSRLMFPMPTMFAFEPDLT